MISNITQNLLKSTFTSNKLVFTPVFNLRKYPKQPKLRRRTIEPIYPPPGLNLQIPDWEVELFMKRIGGACYENAGDKFDTLQEVFEADQKIMKEKGVPPKIRKHIFNIREQLRRGVLTFEYLERRTCLDDLPTKAR